MDPIDLLNLLELADGRFRMVEDLYLNSSEVPLTVSLHGVNWSYIMNDPNGSFNSRAFFQRLSTEWSV